MRLLIIVTVLFSSAAHAGDFSSTPRVLDGGTLAFGQVQIRLAGIDTPETGQSCGILKCGDAATEALVALAEEGTVVCSDLGERWDGRIVAICSVNGQNISEAMVKNGWAFADPKFGKGFRATEGEAEKRRAGLWAHCLTFPWNWRQGGTQVRLLSANGPRPVRQPGPEIAIESEMLRGSAAPIPGPIGGLAVTPSVIYPQDVG